MSDDLYVKEVFRQIEAYLRKKRESVVAVAGSVAVETKNDHSPVTSVDKEIENDLREILASIEPSFGIQGEELGSEGSRSSFWTIDPIDGTSHFIRDNPLYTCMLGLVIDNQPKAALIYNFANDEMFTAPSTDAAYCNGKAIHVSQRPLDEAMVEIECRLKSKRSWKMLDAVVAATEDQVYSFGAGHGFSQVARGRIEARIQIEGEGKLYDFLPGLILVKAAGGAAKTPGQKVWDWRNLDSIASNSRIADDLQKLVESSWLGQPA